MSAGRWVSRWHDEIDPKPVAPGVYKRKAGGYRIRGRVVDPRTGRMVEVRRALPDAKSAREASAALAAELERAKGGARDAEALPRFTEYAATIMARKITDGRIASASGREKWMVILRAHLDPAFGSIYIDHLTAADVEAWKARFAAKVRAGNASPTTGNTILSVLRVITAAAADEYDLKDPMRRVRPFDTRGHRTYTDEAPNSLAPADVPRFLATMREMFPRMYAPTVLGFVTGLRPSSLRPLRRRGPASDVKWDDGLLLVRQSHTRGTEVMPATKTGRDQRIQMPAELVAILRDHVAGLKGKAAASDLLFPSTTGAFLPVEAFDKPFAKCAAAMGLPYKLTPRAMRRTFQDMAREARVEGVITRAISGHATEAMQRHYSTARDHEIAAGLSALVAMAVPAPMGSN
ncbi:MAG: tyrosine-type recombinase/integrase [Myxococcales bacterium]|nr:tyrosine-type recombinase/integrase [Myxococcales bacterium]